MKLDTTILMMKACCYIFIGFTAPLGTALAQWANEGRFPPTINWIVILGTCTGSAAASLLAFLSGSYSDYVAKRTGNGTQFFTNKSPSDQPKKDT